MSDTNRSMERINFCIKGELWEQLPKFFEELHPADIAEIINHAPATAQNKLFELLSDEIKPDVLAELDDQAEADILEEMTAEEISDIIEVMAPDDAADVLGELEDERSAEILNLMDAEESEEVRELLQYEDDTAGGIMTPDFVAVRESMTAAEAIEYIGSMEIAWRWTTPDGRIDTDARRGPLKGTPLVVNGTMYAVSALNLVSAIDPTNGMTQGR